MASRFRIPAGATRWSLLAVVLVAVAYAWPVQSLGCNQVAHYALTKALADGTPYIDNHLRAAERARGETCDRSWIRSHFYAAKPPGLAFASTPLYAALKKAGAVPEDPRRAVWLLGLLTVALPGALLVALVAGRAGTAAAVTLGLGTLVLPFSTLYFSHLLAAMLGFAAFALLTRGRPSAPAALAAGALAGYAVTTEFPLLIVAGALAVYLVTRSHRFRTFVPYAAGLVIGLAPLAAYNVWAFGSVTENVYGSAVLHAGQSGYDVIGANASGFFGVGLPSGRVALELLFSEKGLLVTAPVVAAAVAGLVVLGRRGRRAEAMLAGGIALAYLLYNAGYYLPFGGDVPGPRFLLPALPFLALGLGAAYRTFPGITLALAVPSAIVLGTATLTQPMLGSSDTSVWFVRAAAGDFTETVATVLGAGSGFAAAVPFVVVMIAAAAVAWRAKQRRLPVRRDVEAGAAAVLAWAAVGSAGPVLLEVDGLLAGTLAALGLIAFAALLAVAVYRVERRGLSVRLRAETPDPAHSLLRR